MIESKIINNEVKFMYINSTNSFFINKKILIVKVTNKQMSTLNFHHEKNILYLILFHISVTSATSYCQDIQLNYVNKIYQSTYQYFNFIDITLVCGDLNVYLKIQEKPKKNIKKEKRKKMQIDAKKKEKRKKNRKKKI